MTHIPTTAEIDAEDMEKARRKAEAARRTAVATMKDRLFARRTSAANLRYDLVRALRGRNYAPQVFGRFADDVIAEVAKEFEASGWAIRTVRSTGVATNFQISRV